MGEIRKLSRDTSGYAPEVVYLIRISPPQQSSFYKIGRTRQDLIQRFLYTDIPSWQRIAQSPLMPHRDAVLLEATLHGAFRKKRFWPEQIFGGRSECFRLDEADVTWVTEVFTKCLTSQLGND